MPDFSSDAVAEEEEEEGHAEEGHAWRGPSLPPPPLSLFIRKHSDPNGRQQQQREQHKQPLKNLLSCSWRADSRLSLHNAEDYYA